MPNSTLIRPAARRRAAPISRPKSDPPRLPLSILGLTAVAISLVWSYALTIQDLIRNWEHDPNYSVGMLVPFAAGYMAWTRRADLPNLGKVCWGGLAVLVVGQAIRAYGLFYLYESAERYSLVVTVIGLVLLLAGRETTTKLRWVLVFLFLMVPLPGRIHNMISGPLQGLATEGAVFFLELVAIHVIREGHVLILNDSVPLAVAEACSGLRMLTAFIVVGYVMAYLLDRSAWQKSVLVLSTIPVAILCNLVRLVITALLFAVVSGDVAEKFFHDFAGWTMMPMAIAVLLGEAWILRRLVIADTKPIESSDQISAP
ncbi:MAG: exosortase/archaeosortase family protein [Planctomycetota bacterium]